MDSKKMVLKETGVVAAGQLVCVAAMTGVFALLGYFDYTVILGGVAGALTAILNFFFMAVGISLAADKAEKQDVQAGKSMVTGSYFIRIAVMFAVLFFCAKSGHFQPVALVLPLAFVRPILTVAEFFKKKGV